MKQIIILLIGIALGVFIAKYFNIIPTTNKLVKTKKDYFIDNIGYIKKGTILKVDGNFSESFTRYVLYLNISDGENLDRIDSKKENLITPYWLNENSSILK